MYTVYIHVYTQSTRFSTGLVIYPYIQVLQVYLLSQLCQLVILWTECQNVLSCVALWIRQEFPDLAGQFGSGRSLTEAGTWRATTSSFEGWGSSSTNGAGSSNTSPKTRLHNDIRYLSPGIFHTDTNLTTNLSATTQHVNAR